MYDPHDLQKKVKEQCTQMHPPVRAVFTVSEYDGHIVCSVEIPAVDFAERPCYYAGVGKTKGSYIRIGDKNLPMTDHELYIYEAFRTNTHDDERTIRHTDLSLLDQNRLSDYISETKKDRPGLSKFSEEQVYEMLTITRNGVPTLAAILNFGLYPQGHFPQLVVIAIVVSGNDMKEQGGQLIDRKRIEGTLADILEETIHFCICAGGQVGINTEYHIPVIREALVNALVHRDYSRYMEGTPIHLYLFPDQMEIHIPGSLNARPELRNPTLAAIAGYLLDTPAADRCSGIPVIQKENADLPAPEFQNRRNAYICTYFLNGEPGNHNNPRNLLAFCRTPRSRKEIAEYLGIRTIFYVTAKYINPLLEIGLLEMTIPDKPKSRNQKYFCPHAQKTSGGHTYEARTQTTLQS